MVLYSGYIIGWSLLNPGKVPPRDPPMPFRQKMRESAKLIPCLLLILAVFFSLVLGFATATECAAWGVTGALLLAWWSGTLTRDTFFESVMSATRLTCMIMLILAGAAYTTAAMAYTGIPAALAEWVKGQNLTPGMLALYLSVMYIILGCLIDGISMIVLTAVIVLPMVKQAGLDLIWFGVYLVIHVEMAQITPPVGFNLFVLQNMSGRDTLTVARAAFPFFLLLLVAVFIITEFPQIVLFLPKLAFPRFLTLRFVPIHRRRNLDEPSFPMPPALMLGAAARGRCPRRPRPNGICPRPIRPTIRTSENLVLFAKDVEAATGGKLVDHGSPERLAVQGAGHQARGADRAGADGRGAALDPRERGPDVRHRRRCRSSRPASRKSMKLYKASKPAIEKKLAAQGLMLLFAVPWAPQGIYAKKDLNTIEDMKGLKWRSYNVGTAQIGELVGAQSVTIQAAELPQALATGVVNSFMSSGGTGYDTQGVGVARPLLRHAGLDPEGLSPS